MSEKADNFQRKTLKDLWRASKAVAQEHLKMTSLPLWKQTIKKRGVAQHFLHCIVIALVTGCTIVKSLLGQS